jgi:hypothetical protein
LCPIRRWAPAMGHVWPWRWGKGGLTQAPASQSLCSRKKIFAKRNLISGSEKC